MFYLKLAYSSGCQTATTKLGTVAGPIAHAARVSRNEFDFSQDKADDLWREIDSEPAVTGEESGLGMPSAGGANKTAADDYASSSAETFGSFDHNAPKPHRDHILSSAMQQAFKANDEYDKSYGMGEPALTQPHGSKYARLVETDEKGDYIRVPDGKGGFKRVDRPRKDPRNPRMFGSAEWSNKQANNPLAGGSAPVSLGAPSSAPGTQMAQGLKPPGIPKIKAPGANIMSNVHQNSTALLSSNAIASPGTRALGSPLPTGAQTTGSSLT